MERLLIYEEDGPMLISSFAMEDLDSEDDGSWSESEAVPFGGSDPVLRARRLGAGQLIARVHSLGQLLRHENTLYRGEGARIIALSDCYSCLHRQGLSATARRKVLGLLRGELHG